MKNCIWYVFVCINELFDAVETDVEVDNCPVWSMKEWDTSSEPDCI